MSRAELAEAVNAELARRGVHGCLTDKDIGRYVRGETRWPREHYRWALRTVLGVDNDTALGFYPNRHSRTAPTSTTVVCESFVDGTTGISQCPEGRELATHWSEMLRVLAAAYNSHGANGLLDIVRNELALIDHHRELANGLSRRNLLVVSARWREFGSWIADNKLGKATAEVWLQEAGSMADEAGHEALAAYVLMRRAQRATEAGAHELTAELMQPLLNAGYLPARIRALAAIRHAQARASRRDTHAVRRSIGIAYHLIDQATDTEEPHAASLGGHCNSTYVRAYEAYCRLLLGDLEAAVHDFETVLTGWPAEQRLDEGFFRANLAVALHLAGECVASGSQALAARTIAKQTESQRTLMILNALSASPM